MTVLVVDFNHLHHHSGRRISGELDYPTSSYCQMAWAKHYPVGHHTFSACCNEELRWLGHTPGLSWLI